MLGLTSLFGGKTAPAPPADVQEFLDTLPDAFDNPKFVQHLADTQAKREELADLERCLKLDVLTREDRSRKAARHKQLAVELMPGSIWTQQRDTIIQDLTDNTVAPGIAPGLASIDLEIVALLDAVKAKVAQRHAVVDAVNDKHYSVERLPRKNNIEFLHRQFADDQPLGRFMLLTRKACQ